MAAFIAAVFCGQPSRAGEDRIATTRDQQTRARELLERAWAASDEPRSASVTVHETIRRIATADKVDELDHYWAFDDATGCERWDTTHPVKNRVTRFARNATESLLYQPSGILVRLPRDEKPRVHDAKPFDFRWVGFAPIVSMRSRSSSKQMKDFQFKHYNTSLVAFDEKGDLVRAVWEFPASEKLDCRSVLEMDRRVGMRPVLAEEHYRTIAKDGSRGEWRLEWQTKTCWEKSGETWVPSSARMEAPGLDQVAELIFDWEMVNREIAAEIFEMAGVQAERRLDARNGPPIRE
jgi:hypothetical protein